MLISTASLKAFVEINFQFIEFLQFDKNWIIRLTHLICLRLKIQQMSLKLKT